MGRTQSPGPVLSTQTDETRDTHTDRRENGGTETGIKVRYCVSLPACGEMNHAARPCTGWLIKPSPNEARQSFGAAISVAYPTQLAHYK